MADGATVLIVSASYDETAPLVESALDARRVRHARLNTDLFPTNIRLSLDPYGELLLDVPEGPVYGRAIKSVWYRRHVQPVLPDDLEAGVRDFCQRETRACLTGALAALKTSRWMSPITAFTLANQKAYQLQRARQLGFMVPPTTITNDPLTAARFATNRKLVAKAVSSGYITSPSENEAIFTTLLPDTHTDFQDLDLAPVIFQQFVDKKVDIRVTVVGTTCFSAEIHSQGDPSSRIDWRATNDSLLPHRKHTLPPHISQLCIALTRSLDLAFGAIDLAIDQDGSYVFFEINPNGEWAWIEELIGHPISQAIAAWLDV